MKNIGQILVQSRKVINGERNLDKRLNDLEDAAVAIESEQAPELTRITLLDSNIIRASLERSRRFWVHLSAILAVSLVMCIGVILLSFCCR